MTIRHQAQDDKHPYESPTTPGLYITFRNLLIELVCLNTRSTIGPRFWNNNPYWTKKYSRETRGVKKLSEIFDFQQLLVRQALIQVIQTHNIKALVANKTIDYVVRHTQHTIKILQNQRQNILDNAITTNQNQSTELIDIGDKSQLAKIKAIENGKKKDNSTN